MRPVSVLGGLALLLLPTHLPHVTEAPAAVVRRGLHDPSRDRAAQLEPRGRPQCDDLAGGRPPARRGGAARVRPRAALGRPSLRHRPRPGRPGRGLHLRHRRAAHAARPTAGGRALRRGAHAQLRRPRREGRGRDPVESVRRRGGCRRARSARPGPGRHLRLGRGLQHRAAEGRHVPSRRGEALPGRTLQPLRPRPRGGAGPGRSHPAGRAVRRGWERPATSRRTGLPCARPSSARPCGSRGSPRASATPASIRSSTRCGPIWGSTWPLPPERP